MMARSERVIGRRTAVQESESAVLQAHRHDDIVIQRRFQTHPVTHAVKQVYAVTYPGHDDQGVERDQYEEAERVALTLAEARQLTVWYEENPTGGGRTLVRSFRAQI